MRIAFTIAILLLAFIGVKSQDFCVPPAYYPTSTEIVQGWKPDASVGMNFTSESDYGSALPSWWEKNRKGFAVTGIQIVSVILDASGDAVYDMGKESHNNLQMAWGHTLQATAIGVMGVSLASIVWEGNVWDGVRFGVSWISMRYALHDVSYNVTHGIDLLYADGLKADMTPDGRVVTQLLAFGFSVSFNICEF